MKEFFQLMKRFVSPYKRYIGWAVFFKFAFGYIQYFLFYLVDSYFADSFQDG